MGKLICLKDIRSIHDRGEDKVYIEDKTIITPSAKDYAKANNMIFVEKKEECKAMDKFDISGFSKEDLYKILKVLVDRGLLDATDKKYESKKAANGFKVVDGNSVKLEPLSEETKDKVKYLEVIHSEDSPMQSGYFTINSSSFSVTTEFYETYCVLDGVLDIKVNGEQFRAGKGDIVSVPKGSDIVCSSDGFVNVFYTCGDR